MTHRTYNWAGTAVICGLLACSACSRDARLAGRNVRKDVTVRAVTHYGVTLDEAASPEQVAYVALRAVREDFSGTDPEEREAALDKHFDVCAADVIAARNRTGLKRDEFVYAVVRRWTPTVSHYVADFETDWEAASERFGRTDPRPPKGSNADALECEVLMEVDDPSGDPSARALLVVYLAQDSGFWRVVHLGFDPTRRSIVN